VKKKSPRYKQKQDKEKEILASIILGLDCFTSSDQMNSAKLGKLEQTAHQMQTAFFYFSRIKTKPSEPESPFREMWFYYFYV